MIATLFDPGPPDPKNDAAPSGNGASANRSSNAHNPTRLPLTPPAHHNAPAGTSGVAADRIAGYAGTLRAAVLSMLRERGEHGATDQEIQDALQLPSNTEIPRRWELVKAGAVVASGRKRKTRSNCPATVWVLSEFAPKPPTIAPVTPGDAPKREGGAA